MSDCNPKDCSLPGSSVHGIFQARILEWVAISFPRGSSWIRDWTRVSSIGRQICYRWATREAQGTKESQHSVICVWDRTFVSDHSNQLSFVDIWRCTWYGLEYSLGSQKSNGKKESWEGSAYLLFLSARRERGGCQPGTWLCTWGLFSTWLPWTTLRLFSSLCFCPSFVAPRPWKC